MPPTSTTSSDSDAAPSVDEATRLFEPVRTIRTFETAIDNIIAGIERGRLRKGDRMPNESGLAQQLEISKPTLRQALRVLERSGLISVRQGKLGGIFVVSNYLPAEALSTNIATEEHMVLEMLRARRVLESAITQEALVAATADDFLEIERTVELLIRDELKTEELLRADMMFHRAVGRATHNPLLEESQRTLYKHLAGIRGVTHGTETRVVCEIHRHQLEAMKSRDPAVLAAALDRHFRYLEERFASSLHRSWDDLFAVAPVSAALPVERT
jgi:GntR family transcriptional repressor for pyruvate dehydrogenase complex